MQDQGTAKLVLRWTALGALFLATLTPLIVVNSFYFPFITGKSFYFRILVEIAVAAWMALAFLDKAYRPRFSWIGIAAIAFVAWMFFADLTAVNVSKAFWSNFERSEGWILLIHLLGFFYAASAVLRVEKKWRTWFLASLAVGVVVSIHGIFQQLGVAGFPIHQGSTRIDSSFGNSAYFAVYLLFNTFIALWLAATERYAWLKYALYSFAVIEAFLIFLTETRGTVLGLAGGLILSGLIAAFTGGKQWRRFALGGVAVVILLGGGLYAARGTSFVQGNHVLQRVSSISLKAGATRFAIWHMALEGFVQSPKTVVFGWGQEGFNYVFNKYYDPALFTQEPWFDRAHNVPIDWLIEGGLPALLLYLSLFGSLVWLVFTRSEISRAERVFLLGGLAGYFIHNLFVFDNLYSYVYFFAILAFIDARVGRPIPWFERQPELSPNDAVAYALPMSAIAALAMVWAINIPSINACAELITAITPSASGAAANLATFQNLVQGRSYPSVQEVREQLVSFATQVSQDSTVSASVRQQFAQLAISQMQEQVAMHPGDARELLELSFAYGAAGNTSGALTAITNAIAASPKKESLWIQKALLEWNTGQVAQAQADFDHAYALAPQFQQLAMYAAAGDYAAGNAAKGDQLLSQAYGTTTVDNDTLALAYYQSKDWTRLIRLWQLRANKPGATVQTWFGLAASYYAAGQNAKSIALLQQIAKQYPEASSSVSAAITQIEHGTPVQ